MNQKNKKRIENSRILNPSIIHTDLYTFFSNGIFEWVKNPNFLDLIINKDEKNIIVVFDGKNWFFENPTLREDETLKVYTAKGYGNKTKIMFLKTYIYFNVLNKLNDNNDRYLLSEEILEIIKNSFDETNSDQFEQKFLINVFKNLKNRFNEWIEFLKKLVSKEDDFDDKRIDEVKIENGKSEMFSISSSFLYSYAKLTKDNVYIEEINSFFTKKVFTYSNFWTIINKMEEATKGLSTTKFNSILNDVKQLLDVDLVRMAKSVLFSENETVSKELIIPYKKEENPNIKFSVKNLSIYEYIKEIIERREIEIPIFQRKYTWGDSYVFTFLEDIKNYIENKQDDFYYFGTILHSKPVDSDINAYRIIDGQQRTTTIILVSFVLYKILLNKNQKVPKILCDMFEIDQECDGVKITKIIKKFVGIKNSESYKNFDVLLSGDSTMIANTFKKCSNKEQKIIYDNLLSIYEKLSEYLKINKNDDEWLINYTNIFLEKFRIVLITTTTQKDFLYYQKMNLLTKPLEDIELLKSKLYGIACDENLSRNAIEKFMNTFKEKFEKQFSSESAKTSSYMDCLARNYHFVSNGFKFDLPDKEYSKLSKTFIYIDDAINKKMEEGKKAADILNYLVKFATIILILHTTQNVINNLQNKLDILKIDEDKKRIIKWLIPHIDIIVQNGKYTTYIPLVYAILDKHNLFNKEPLNAKPTKVFSNIANLLFVIEKWHFNWLHTAFDARSYSKAIFKLAEIFYKKPNMSIQELKTLMFKSTLNVFHKIPKKTFKETLKKELEKVYKVANDTESNNSQNKKYNLLLKRIMWYLTNDLSIESLDLDSSSKLEDYYTFYTTSNTYEHMEATNRGKQGGNVTLNYINLIGNGLPIDKELNATIKDKDFVGKQEDYKNNLVKNPLYVGYKDCLVNIQKWKNITNKKIMTRTNKIITLLSDMYGIDSDE